MREGKKIMLDAPLKHLSAEEVGRLVGRDERLVQRMYRAQLIDAVAGWVAASWSVFASTSRRIGWKNTRYR